MSYDKIKKTRKRLSLQHFILVIDFNCKIKVKEYLLLFKEKKEKKHKFVIQIIKHKEMKKINTFLFALIVLVSSSFAQSKKAAWVQKATFQKLAKVVYDDVTKFEYKSIRATAADLYTAAKYLNESVVPKNYKVQETKVLLGKVMMECAQIQTELANGGNDDKVREMTIYTYRLYSKIDKECKISE